MFERINEYYCKDRLDFTRKCDVIEAQGVQVAYSDLYDAQSKQIDGYEKIYLLRNKLYRIAENLNRIAYNGERYVATKILGADDISHAIREHEESYFVHGLGVTRDCYKQLCRIYNVTTD